MVSKKIIKPLILLSFVILAVYLGKIFDVGQYLNQETLSTTIMSLGVWAPLGFILLYMIGTVFFFPGTPISIAGGFIFGEIQGTMLIVIGATLGSALAFLFARFLGKDYVDKILKRKSLRKLEIYDEKLEKNGFLTVLFLRLVPLFPFNGLNFALGLTKVRFRHFILATLIGIIPGSFILANLGANATDFRSPKFILFIALFILLAIVPSVYKKIKNRGARK